MAATPTIGTPPAAAKAAPAKPAPKPTPAAETTPEVTEVGGLNALLESATPELVTEAESAAESDEAEEVASSPAASEHEASAEPAKSKLEEVTTSEELFADEALATPEGAQRARDVLRAAKKELVHRQAKLDRYELRLEARAKKDAGERDRSRAVVERAEAVGQAIEREIQISLTAPSARARLAALGKIIGRDGMAYFEELSLGIAQDGPGPAPSRTEKQLLERIDQLENGLVARDGRAEAEAVAGRVRVLEAGVAQKMNEIAADCADEEAYPTLAGKIAEGAFDVSEAAEWVADQMKAHYTKTKKSLARAEAIRMLEARLVKALAGTERAGQSPERSSGTLPTVPSSPARRAGTRGITVTPTVADRSAGRGGRKLTEQERLDDAARDPDLMGALFGALSR
jgi:hypothetical protein